MRLGTSLALGAALLVVMSLSVFGEVWVLPRGIERTTAMFPEVAPLATLGLVWGVAAITCCQAIIIIGLRLVALARNERNFEASAYRWFRAILVCLLGLVALVVAALILLSVLGYSTPLMFWLTGVAVIAGVASGALALSRSTRRPRQPQFSTT
jgi:hypothetical protein